MIIDVARTDLVTPKNTMSVTPIVSIIVPVYNAEKYLRRCLDSILAQSFSDWECIIVNDASPDGVGEIISDYAQRDKRFKVITKTVNGGVSKARQTGLDNAIGKYVIHADPDDSTDKDWLKELYNTAESEQADMTMCDFDSIFADKTVTYCQEPKSFDNEDILEDFLMERLWGVVWNKLVKRDCFAKWNISFHPEMNMWEDLYVTFKLLLSGVKVAYVPKVLYHYDSKINQHSIVMRRKQEHIRSVMIFVDEFSPILTQPRYYEGWYHIKREVKLFLFQANATKDNLVRIYREINTRLIREGKASGFSSIYSLLALAVDGHAKLARVLYRIEKTIYRSLK